MIHDYTSIVYRVTSRSVSVLNKITSYHAQNRLVQSESTIDLSESTIDLSELTVDLSETM